jgi:uracil-DNA glycosylase
MITCPLCQGSTLVPNPKPNNRDGYMLSCPNCKGKGFIGEATKRYKIAIVGEAWGAEEAQVGLPFVGSSGRLLNQMLEEAGIERQDCFVTNVFNLQPKAPFPNPKNLKDNDVRNLCTTKALSKVPMPEMSKGEYLQDQYWPEVVRLYKELADVKPNLVIALGNSAVWALTGTHGIRKIRGTVSQASRGGSGVTGLKLLPTYHPAAVLRDWSMRSVVVADLMKAERQSHFPDIRRPRRELWLEPSISHIKLFYEHYVLKNCSVLSADIETAGADQITCVGFAPTPERAIVIPFVDNRKPNGSYWPTPELEAEAWGWVARYMLHPEKPEIEVLGQNFLYDINWLWTLLGITPANFLRDTMLKHHAYNPELEKGLGFLGSVYTDEPAWKTMRGKGLFTIKRGE